MGVVLLASEAIIDTLEVGVDFVELLLHEVVVTFLDLLAEVPLEHRLHVNSFGLGLVPAARRQLVPDIGDLLGLCL